MQPNNALQWVPTYNNNVGQLTDLRHDFVGDDFDDTLTTLQRTCVGSSGRQGVDVTTDKLAGQRARLIHVIKCIVVEN